MDLWKRHRLNISVMEDEVVYAIREMLEGRTLCASGSGGRVSASGSGGVCLWVKVISASGSRGWVQKGVCLWVQGGVHPPGRQSPGQTLWADIPLGKTSPWQTSPGKHPLPHCMLGYMPPGEQNDRQV